MNIKKILLIIFIIYLIILHCKMWSFLNQKKNIENFAFSDTDKNEIRGIIKEIYNTDMDAIRTLADFAKKIQDGNNLNIPGNLTVSGALNVTGNITGSSALTVGGTITGKSSLSITNNISSDYIYTNRLDIKGKHGTTHFNYGDGGTTYLRDNVEVYDHLYTKRLDIKGKHATTHFNYNDGGTTYLRDDVYIHDYLETNKLDVKNNVNIAGHLTGTNITLNTGGGAQIASQGSSGQFIMRCAGHGWRYVGAGACHGDCNRMGSC